MRPLDPRLLAHASAARTHIITTALIGTLSAGLVLFQASLLGPGLASFFDGNMSTAWVRPLAVVVVIRALLNWWSDTSSARASALVKSQLRSKLAQHVVRDQRTSLPASDIATLASRGLDALDPYFARYLPALVMAVTVPLGAGVWILTNDPLSALIVGLTIPLVPFFMILVGKFTAVETARQWQAMQTLGGRFLDLVTGLTTLKAFNRSKAQVAAVAAAGESYRATTMKVLRVSFLSALVLELLSTVSVALVAVSIGLRLDNGTLQLREALTVLILVPEVYLPLRAVGAQFHAVAEGLEAAGQVFDLLDNASAEHSEGITTVTTVKRIAVSEASFRYPGSPALALSPTSLEATSGSMTAITGPSGVGKTTLLNVIAGLTAPTDGTVMADEVAITDLDQQQWRSLVGYLPQSPWLPDGSVRSAIAMGRPISDDELRNVLDIVGLHDVPLASPVSRTSGLSAGQRRRIALARTLAGHRPVLLLDEPTASLDSQTENLVAHHLRMLADQGALIIVVSHRPALTALCDAQVSVR